MIVGDKFEHDFTVSPAVYNGFLAVFNDHNPLHTQKDFATGHGFNDVVMHGNILNGFVSYFIGELLPIKNVAIIQQDIKYHLPVYLNDKLSFTAVVDIYHESVSATEFKFEFKNSAGKKVAKGKIMIRVL